MSLERFVAEGHYSVTVPGHRVSRRDQRQVVPKLQDSEFPVFRSSTWTCCAAPRATS